MASYDALLLDAIGDPGSVTWHGPPRAVSSLLEAARPTVSALAVGESDGTQRRIDATVHAVDGREWSVPFFVTDDTVVVTKLWVYERPDPHDGTSGLAVILNGASAAGKSTLLEALLDEAGAPWIVFDEPHIGRMPTEYLIWRDLAPALHGACFVAMRSLVESGIPVATSAGGFGQQVILEALEGVPLLRVGLHCSEPTRWERLGHEPHKRPIASLERSVEDVHAGWTYDLELRSDEATPHELARSVLDLASQRT